MGTNFSRRQLETVEDSDVRPNSPRKRKRDRRNLSESDSETSDDDNEFETLLRTPKRKKLKTTSRYIYERLFIEGTDSDITVKALNKDWKLHKLYLCQSPYFNSMFSGSWRESSMTTVTITIADPNITLDALTLTFGSLYKDEIAVEPVEVIPVLACATLFQLEGLINQCYSIMEETINSQTVFKFYESATLYGANCVHDACLKWLKCNLLHSLPEQLDRLREVTPNLISLLIDSPDLIVMQTEFSVYVLLRLWLFLLLNPSWSGTPQEAVQHSHKFFKEKVQNSNVFFLESDEGQTYSEVFKKLRLQHLINHHLDMQMLLSDRIIPQSWMYPVYQSQWQTLLRMDQSIDTGPASMSKEIFDRLCLRCGRTLNNPGQQHMWRWTGFNMGLDLIVTFNDWTLSVKRSVASAGTSEHEAFLSNHKKRNIFYRVSAFSLNDQKQIVYEASSGIQAVCLGRNCSHAVLTLDAHKVTFPLLLSFNVVVSTPTEPHSQSESDIVEVENVAP